MRAPVQPDLTADAAVALAATARALADPTRPRIVDTLRKATPEAVCQCELMLLFGMSQPALSKHLKMLVIGSERRGLWGYYYMLPESTEKLIAWLS